MISFCTPIMPVLIPTELEGYTFLIEVKAGNNVLVQDNEKYYFYGDNINNIQHHINYLLNYYITENNTACTCKIILIMLEADKNIILKYNAYKI